MLLAILLVLILLCGAAAAGVIHFGGQVAKLDTIYPGTTAAGMDLSGMTLQEAKYALAGMGREKYDGLSVTAELPLGNSLTVTAEEANIQYNADALAEEAFAYGRSGGFLDNAISYAKARYMSQNSFESDKGLEVTIDEDAIRALVAKAAADIDAQLLESGVEVTDTEIRLTKGASGLTIDEDFLFTRFRDALLAGDGSSFTYESAPELDSEYDFSSLHDELYSELKSSRLLYAPEFAAEGTPAGMPQVVIGESMAGDDKLDFGGAPYLVTESSVGVDFDVAEAERLWAAAGYGESVSIPITTTYPEHTEEEISGLLFADNLSKNWTMVRLWRVPYCEEVRTSLSGSSKNRISNVKKACEILDGMILMPGQVFSYNEALGERTEQNGWLTAPAYANGEVRQEFGGGICQVSSTLYNAALYSNLKIVERECHQFQVGYLPWGMDATVSWGWPDFKFQNDQTYPIRLHAWVDESANEGCVQIQGTDVDHVYVIMRFSNGEFFDQTGTYHDANGNPLAVGMEAATWRVLYHDGDDYATATPISENYEAYSKYNYHTEDIEARNVPLPTPAPAEEPGGEPA